MASDGVAYPFHRDVLIATSFSGATDQYDFRCQRHFTVIMQEVAVAQMFHSWHICGYIHWLLLFLRSLNCMRVACLICKSLNSSGVCYFIVHGRE